MAYIKDYHLPPPGVKGLENEVMWESEQSEPFIIANCGLQLSRQLPWWVRGQKFEDMEYPFSHKTILRHVLS